MPWKRSRCYNSLGHRHANAGAGEDEALRLRVDGHAVALEPSPPQAEDLQFLYLGRPVLVVARC